MIKKYKRIRSGWMRRTSKIYLKHLNLNKSINIRYFLNNYHNAIKYTINKLWSSEQDIKLNKLLSKDDTFKISEKFYTTARLAQCIGKQAKEIVSSQKELSKRKQHIPKLKSHIANLDERFIVIKKFNGHFDMCIRTRSGVPEMIIPFNWTSHTNKFINDGWLLGNSIQLGYDNKGIFIILIFEKQKPNIRTEGNILGIDRGYNTILACSDGQMIGTDLKLKINKITKRNINFHNFINCEINYYIKQLDISNIKVIILENLKNIKQNSRGKFPRKLNRLLSFWHYTKVSKRLEQLCEENGILLQYKNPAYTSQKCSVCGKIDKRNRKGEKFLCIECGHTDNADHNASKNLELLGLAGVYSLRSLPNSK